VWELWRELMARGLKPGITICRSCVRAAKLDMDVEKALGFVEYIRRNSAFKYDFKSWLMAMQLCGMTGRIDEEKQLRREMELKRNEFSQ
jgi:hypothetical protein